MLTALYFWVRPNFPSNPDIQTPNALSPVVWFWVFISSSFFLLANSFVIKWNSEAIKITTLPKDKIDLKPHATENYL